MIIWGSMGREIVQSVGEFYCPQCDGQRDCHLVRIATYFTLYFVPLFETQYHGDGIKCLSCQLLFSTNVLDVAAPSSPRGKRKRVRNRRNRQQGDDYGL